MLAITLALLAGALFASPLAVRLLGRNAGFFLALPLLIAAGLGIAAYEPGTVHTEEYAWMPTIGVDLNLTLDGLSFIFLMLVTLIGAGVLVYSTRYLSKGKDYGFYFFIVGFAFAMALVVTTDNLIVFYVAWELTTLCSFFLIAMTGGFAGRAPAIRTLLVTVFGGLLLLIATVIMIVTTGSVLISEVIAYDGWTRNQLIAVALLVATAAFTKSAQFPFQAWLPDSMAAISPVSAYLHAAAMVKAGIYLMMRYSPLMLETSWWQLALLGAGGFTALFGAFTAIKRDDLKEVLAYSTMSQLGLITFTIGLGTEVALTAAIVHTVSHAIFKAALFMLIGVVDHEAGTRRYSKLRGLKLNMPVTKTLVIIAAASMAGLPPLFGFVSKEKIIDATLETPVADADYIVLLIGVIVITSIMTFAYSTRIAMGVWGRRKAEKAPPGVSDEPKTEAGPVFLAVPAVLGILIIVLGFAPSLLETPIYEAGLAMGYDHQPGLALWHGFNLALAITVFIVVCGLIIVSRINTVRELLSRMMAPISGLSVVEEIRAGIINVGGYVARASGTTSMRRHLAAPLALLIVLAFAALLLIQELPPLAADPSISTDWVMTGLIALGVATALRGNSRLTVVIVISIVGFAMTLWFYALGAADVAITQLTVEVLTVVVMVLILHRLPNKFEPEKRPNNLISMAIAGGMGVATFLGVIAFTGRREKSEAAEYFLREAENETGGTNIVNTILVDFRALDTFGELTVLGIAGLVVAIMVANRPLSRPVTTSLDMNSPVAPPRENAIFLQKFLRLIGPLILIFSVVLFVRGHYDTGGGFVAGLVGGAGLSLMYLAAPSDVEGRLKLSYNWLIGGGVTIGAVTGLFGLLEGSFLAPFDINLGFTTMTSTLVFDLGVYLGVIGMVVAAVNLLGTPDQDGLSPDKHFGNPEDPTLGGTREHKDDYAPNDEHRKQPATRGGQ